MTTNKRKTPVPQSASQTPQDHNQRIRDVARRRLDELFTEASQGRFHGRIAIEVTFEGGRAGIVYRKIDGRDK